MIDLQALMEETIDFKWIDGKELHVRQPSTRFVNKVDRTENTLENAQELVLEFIQNNKEKRIFTKEEISELNRAQLTAILMAVLGFAQKVENDPNS
ncbi:hypothetical protein [Enterococcus faecalis]|uniref:hypothetical protein n=1 Tax=Enterococcus TaxID=1350 RepID=UPI000B3D4D63|nr:hypothetical protein [Enterococcus faecalis]ARV03961.1 hypothetical protein A6B47_08920 [Enterococcus faecalis]MBG9434981.1 hypothetical protein [Enterococcus faecalis]MBG9437752.1 hypothetical protein [Enterococcus faecalis]MBG9440646.1 hypothetical protein [Enterococcus faecalis]TGY24254.1 hypothetical protein E5349_02410 [Enterococcus faecalis]